MNSVNFFRLLPGIRLARIIIVALLVFAGCAAPPHRTAPVETPDIVSMTTLPVITTTAYYGQIKLEVVFHILSDGSVEDVVIQSGSGDIYWDAAARDSMKLWRFTKLPPDGPPLGQFVKRTILVRIQDPIILNLGELTAPDRSGADSLYALLKSGVDFFTLLDQLGENTSGITGRHLGDVNIARFPERVRNKLGRLRVNEFTEPVLVGDTYFIYQRLKTNP